MKKSVLSILMVFAFFIWYVSTCETDRKQALKEFPKKFAYYVHHKDSSVTRGLGSEDKDCMNRVKDYYEKLDEGETAYVPTCTEFLVGLEEPVYVMDEGDSISMKVVYFYKGTSGREKYHIGYLLKSSLHETPYEKSNSD